MLQPGDRVVVGVSAGPDSVALAHVLWRLAPELDLYLHLFHLHHGLRGAAADADAAYVEELARQLNCPCTVRRAAVEELAREAGGSLEAVGREIRYREMATLAAATGARCIATGHHRNDQAETLLLRLVRGSGRLGLTGIPPVRPAGSGAPPECTVIRPLIDVSRAEVEAYCREQGLVPQQDLTNADPRFLRNRIRLELLPLLEQGYNRRIVDRLADLAGILRDEEEFLQAAVTAAWDRRGVRAEPDAVTFPAGSLTAEPPAVARRMLRRAAAGLDAGLDLAHVDSVLEHAAAAAGTCVLDLPGGLAAVIEYGSVTLQRTAGRAEETAVAAVHLAAPGVTRVPALGLELDVEEAPAVPGAQEGGGDAALRIALDPSSLPGPLLLRTRRPGDRLFPTGMDGSKKLQDLFVDLKVPRHDRNRIPILAAGSEIVWVVGIRADRRFLAAVGEPGWLVRARRLDNPS